MLMNVSVMIMAVIITAIIHTALRDAITAHVWRDITLPAMDIHVLVSVRIYSI